MNKSLSIRLARLAAAVYTAAGFAYVVLRFILGDRSAVVTIGNIFLQWFLLLAFPLFVLCILWRSPLAGMRVAPFALAFIALYGPRFLPKTPSPVDNTPPLRVVVFNTANFYTSGQEITQVIQASGADIVGLIELRGENGEAVASALSESHPHQLIAGEGVPGKGLFSRYPIVSQESFTLFTDRPNIAATLDVDGQPLTIYVVHPPSPDAARALNFYAPDPNNPREIAALLARAPSDAPTLLLGDFNLTDQSGRYRDIIAAGYTDAFRAVGFGFGGTFVGGRWRVRTPAVTRIDYIFASSHLSPQRAWLGPKTGSDHLPVIADLVLR